MVVVCERSRMVGNLFIAGPSLESMVAPKYYTVLRHGCYTLGKEEWKGFDMKWLRKVLGYKKMCKNKELC